MKNERRKLINILGKIGLLVEKIDWGKAELRSNEIDIVHEHLRNVLKEFEQIPWLVQERKEWTEEAKAALEKWPK